MAKRKITREEKAFEDTLRQKVGAKLSPQAKLESTWSELSGDLADALESLESLSETVDELPDAGVKSTIADDLSGVEKNIQSALENMDALEQLLGIEVSEK